MAINFLTQYIPDDPIMSISSLIVTIIVSFTIGVLMSILLVKVLKHINDRYMYNYFFKNKTTYFNVFLLIVLIGFINSFFMFFEWYQDIIWHYNSDFPLMSLIVGFILGLDFPYEEPKPEEKLYEDSCGYSNCNAPEEPKMDEPSKEEKGGNK